jgi:hypothetical protein
VGYQLFGKSQNKGGHTYMSSNEKKGYIALLSQGSMMEVLNVSVKLHDNRDRETHQKDVWAAIKLVTEWFECRGPKSVAGQSIRTLSLNVAGNVHDIYAGPMLPLLVSLYLSTTVAAGVSIVLETYGGKVLESIKVVPPINNKISMDDAKKIKELFKVSLNTSSPFLISRFGQFSKSLSHSELSMQVNNNINLKWGIGCTVVTQCETPKLFEPSIDTVVESTVRTGDSSFDSGTVSLELDNHLDGIVLAEEPPSPVKLFDLNSTVAQIDFGSHSDDDDKEFLSSLTMHSVKKSNSLLTSNNNLNHELYDYSPAFTVINALNSKLLTYCNNPLTWFMDERGNEIRKNMDTSNNFETNSLNHLIDDDDDFEETVADSESNGVDSHDNDHASNSASHRSSKDGHSLHKFLALSSEYNTYASFPIFGGILPLSMQPTNYTRKGHTKSIIVPDTISQGIFRIQQYAVLPKNACGECGVPLKNSSEMAHYELDIYSDNVESIYNLQSFDQRLGKFIANSKVNMDNMTMHGNPGRIEIAFDSLTPEQNENDLLNGIRDVLQICLNSTKSYSAIKCASIVQFALDGTVSRLRTMQDMMKEYIGRPEKYYELYHIRTEAAARMHSFYSGRGTLKNLHLFSPKNSYMAGRPTHKMLMPLSRNCRERVLKRTIIGVDLFETFLSNLFDCNGCNHKRIEPPLFQLKFVDKIVNNIYKCGKVCSKCWMVFATEKHINAFDCHSCIDKIKGLCINITDQRFVQHHGKMLEDLNDRQSLFVSMVHHDGPGSPPNVFLTGGAGCGKTHTLKISIADTLYRYGRDCFVVIAATKIAASLVNGVTYHAFLGLTGREGEDSGEAGKLLKHTDKVGLMGKHINNLRDTSMFLRIQTTLRVIYIDEIGMMSKDQFEFLDEMLRFCRKNNEPFGGIQIILCGDVLQLSPICKFNTPGEVFFFESDSYVNGKFKSIYLSSSYRQKDPKFVRILNRMREGCCTEADMVEINDVWGSEANFTSALDALMGLLKLYRNERVGNLGDVVQQKIGNKARSFFHNKDLLLKHKEDIDKLERDYNEQLRFQNSCDVRPPQYLPAKTELAECTRMVVSTLYKTNRLKKQDEHTSDYNFVINCENVENDAIKNEYDESRKERDRSELSKTTLHVNQAEDCSGEGIILTSAMRDFLNHETKTDQIFVVYIGERVKFTSNGIGVFVANNVMANVTQIKCDAKGNLESITVEPCVAPGIIPHPVVVTAKLYSAEYPDPSGNGSITVTRLQFPLKAADCGNAFTTQGISLSIPVIFNGSRLMTNSMWAKVYVAASRVTDKKFFFSLFYLRSSDIKANKIALAFDMLLRQS